MLQNFLENLHNSHIQCQEINLLVLNVMWQCKSECAPQVRITLSVVYIVIVS